MTKKLFITIIIIILLAAVAGAAYWWFFLRVVEITPTTGGGEPEPTYTFNPFNPNNNNRRTATTTVNNSHSTSTVATSTVVNNNIPAKIPALRQLSDTPVGGYGASSTATTTIVRWVDRGRGNIFEARSNTLDITTISNTLLPKIYNSVWDKNLNYFIGQYLGSSNDIVTTITAEVRKRVVPKTTTNSRTATSSITVANNRTATSTSRTATSTIVTNIATTTATNGVTNSNGKTETPYELKGKIISGNVIGTAVSPKKDRVLVVVDDGNKAIGYISNFDGSKQVQAFSLPMRQINIDWPEENTISIVTKDSSEYVGYLYLLNVKTGEMTKILGGVAGLQAKVSHDATRVLFSGTGNNKIATALYDVKSKKAKNVVFLTMAEKCTWGNKIKEDLYCSVPFQIPDGVYPDDWNTGKVSTNDSIWGLNAITGEANLVADLVGKYSVLADGYNLGMDDKDNFLFFVNKKDQSLWMMDLVAGN